MKPFFSNKDAGSSYITLMENEAIVSEDHQVAETFNKFFSDAVRPLNVEIPLEHTTRGPCYDDLIEQIIFKYSNHPSVKNIQKYVEKGNFSFDIASLAEIELELKLFNPP